MLLFIYFLYYWLNIELSLRYFLCANILFFSIAPESLLTAFKQFFLSPGFHLKYPCFYWMLYRLLTEGKRNIWAKNKRGLTSQAMEWHFCDNIAGKSSLISDVRNIRKFSLAESIPLTSRWMSLFAKWMFFKHIHPPVCSVLLIDSTTFWIGISPSGIYKAPSNYLSNICQRDVKKKSRKAGK